MASKPIISKPSISLETLQAQAVAAPDDLALQLRYGWALYGAGRLDQARQFLEKLRARFPKDLELLYGLGLTLKKAGESEEAHQVFLAVKELAKEVPDRTRASMLGHITQGHLNMLERGKWDLEKEIWGKV
jgi:tetratricopeptide (TPR) repeat protein